VPRLHFPCPIFLGPILLPYQGFLPEPILDPFRQIDENAKEGEEGVEKMALKGQKTQLTKLVT
jgi:hypothetical protein